MKAKIWELSEWINETNPSKLKEYIGALLNESGFKLLHYEEYFYNPYGYSALWFLAESHCAIHTFPEENKTYIQLSSCNKTYYLYFKNKLRKIHQSKSN